MTQLTKTVALKAELTSHDTEPCLFTRIRNAEFHILLLLVDHMLIARKDKCELWEVKSKLQNEFEMTNLGTSKGFLAISIEQNREKRKTILNQEKYMIKLTTHIYGYNIGSQ